MGERRLCGPGVGGSPEQIFNLEGQKRYFPASCAQKSHFFGNTLPNFHKGRRNIPIINGINPISLKSLMANSCTVVCKTVIVNEHHVR